MGGKVSGFGFCERVESVAGDGSEGLFDIAESFMDLANSLGERKRSDATPRVRSWPLRSAR